MGIYAKRFTVDILPKSQAFMERVAERKAAQAAEKAKLDLISSVNALHYFADSYVPEGVSADVRQAQERTKAYQQIGRVTHTDEEDKWLQEDYQALFDKLMKKENSVKNTFDSLQNLLVNYASGGSKNNVVLDLLNTNNAGSINRMFQYWSTMF